MALRSHAVHRVCVYAGSNPGSDPVYAEGARALATELADRGIGLVYGGGKVGLMGVLADTILRAGGEAVGVMPQALIDREIGHPGLTELKIVSSMHERKALMAELSDAFVALPGGLGTLEELAEAATWTQLGLHAKPIGLLDVEDFWRSLETWLDQAVAERFVRPEHRGMLIRGTAIDPLLERLAAWRPATAEKWLDRPGQT
jgi:uncharacterized protein (TIGR00730 family)